MPRPMGSRNPRALSSALATLGSPQPWALGFLNSEDPFVSASKYYLAYSVEREKQYPIIHLGFLVNINRQEFG